MTNKARKSISSNSELPVKYEYEEVAYAVPFRGSVWKHVRGSKGFRRIFAMEEPKTYIKTLDDIEWYYLYQERTLKISKFETIPENELVGYINKQLMLEELSK